MFGLFNRKTKNKEEENSYAGRRYGPFILMIPEDWYCNRDEGGTLRAGKDDTVRLSISIRDMTAVADYSPEALFEAVKAGYFDSDINWGAYSEVIHRESLIIQRLEYADDPRMVIAVADKTVDGRRLALIVSFAGNSGSDTDACYADFIRIMETIEIAG